jgi:hypothetical protein
MYAPMSMTLAKHALLVSLTPVMHQYNLWHFVNAFKGTISKKTSHQ